MSERTVTDWDRYALVVRVAGILAEGHAFGRKALQKVFYLLQELAGIPLGYRYRFYTYGVYSFELASTLATVENLKGVVANYDPAFGAYELGRGEKAEALEAKGHAFLAEFGEQIDRIVALARGKTGKILELISTIVFVALNEDLGGVADEQRLLERVAELKPKFSTTQILDQVQELRLRGCLPSE
ncbi:MAG TPA: hypothetical protein VMF67_12140 [Rhizomicrobium sp.]|nr:hypothetical protein [Rhizomicrobium sp.]